jgi:hypothetical protein
MAEKVRWGSQPGKERGDWSRSETAYLRAAAALKAGRRDARNPALTLSDCPPSISDELKTYWRSAFNDERRALAN